MTYAPPVSLIIVSRQRQDALRQMLSALRFQSYQNLEVIVVSDAPDAGFLADIPFVQNMLHLSFDVANISAARNLGLTHAQGDIVAFCDDDAVPDPNWLSLLVQPFTDQNVASAGGYVRGRNGISYQWKAMLCDGFGEDSALTIDETVAYTVIDFDGTRFAKLQGTNCAFRRKCVLEIGGFDEGFRFFLDETDVCLRLAKAGYSAAFVPNAQVHHGFEQSTLRSQSRVPKSLFEIGASKRRFLEKHGEGRPFVTVIDQFFADQKQRLIRLMIDGRIEPGAVPGLMKSLQNGFGKAPELTPQNPFPLVDRGFSALKHSGKNNGVILAGSILSRRKLIDKAVEFSSLGRPVCIFRFSYTGLYHKRFFDVRGFWVQTGGVFGKSKRTDSPIRMWTLLKRTHRELTRIEKSFDISEIYFIKLFRNFVILRPKRANNN